MDGLCPRATRSSENRQQRVSQMWFFKAAAVQWKQEQPYGLIFLLEWGCFLSEAQIPSFIRAAGQVAQCSRGTHWCPVWGHRGGHRGSHQGRATPNSAGTEHIEADWNLQQGLHRLQSLPERGQEAQREKDWDSLPLDG